MIFFHEKVMQWNHQMFALYQHNYLKHKCFNAIVSFFQFRFCSGPSL